MLIDNSLLEQLKTIFTKLENEVELVYKTSSHDKQLELVEMLSSLQQASGKIKITASSLSSSLPEFYLRYQNQDTTVSFVGVPGGHEFSSLILAILNADGKGKMPDESTIKRIKNLQGKIDLKTFISLSCENCPEVVQTLNLFALLNPNISHQMINGELTQGEIDRLKIQGVPSVIHNDQMILSGKNSLGEILTKLESHFGSNPVESTDLGSYDVVVIGGGPAGSSAAIYSARKGLKVAVITGKIGGQVQETKGIENLISIPYTEGPALSAQLESHMRHYPIDIFEHRQVKTVSSGVIKELTLSTNESLSAKSIIIATGAKWRELNIPGEKEYLGRGVAFCPHCDGPYYKGKDIAVIGGGNSGVEAAIDLSGIVKSITLIEYNSSLKADKVLVDKLKSLPNVTILTSTKTVEVVGDGTKVNGLKVENLNNQEIAILDLDGVFVQIGLVPNSQFIQPLVKTNRFGEIEVNEKGKTNIDGIYAAGDVTTTPYKQIIISMGEGAKAALSCFEDLILKN